MGQHSVNIVQILALYEVDGFTGDFDLRGQTLTFNPVNGWNTVELITPYSSNFSSGRALTFGIISDANIVIKGDGGYNSGYSLFENQTTFINSGNLDSANFSFYDEWSLYTIYDILSVTNRTNNYPVNYSITEE